MKVEGWKYYNHAAVPDVLAYEKVNLKALEDGSIWKMEGHFPILARWISDFDCGYETDWWLEIKDQPFDLFALKSKRRYNITFGNRNFDVKIINPCDYKEELYHVQMAAYAGYPAKYRPNIHKGSFFSQIDTWKDYTVFAAFTRETDELVGYACMKEINDGFSSMETLKANPDFEKLCLNAAIIDKIMVYYEEFLKRGGIISQGERNINHETNFQEYLERLFGFRKAYCKLNVQYNPKIAWIIKVLYPLRNILRKFDDISILHKVNAILKMEEICQDQERME